MHACSVCHKEFESERGLKSHIRYHNEAFMKNYKEKISGENNYLFGKENKWGHHSEYAKRRIAISRLGNENPAKRPEIRNKISQALKSRNGTSWNKGIKWNRSKFHDSKMERMSKSLERIGYKVITTHGYVPDAILIDFNNRKVKAFELNPSSIIRVEERSKKKGYDESLHMVIKK